MPGLTIPHLADLGAAGEHVGRTLDGPQAWDALRTASEPGPYGLPATRAELDSALDERPEVQARMRALATWLDAEGIGRLASYGAGGGLVEAALQRAWPRGALTVTEASPATVARLVALFPDVAVRRHDLRTDGPLTADAHLLHRLDTEFRKRPWRQILGRFADERVVFVATELYAWSRLQHDVRQLWARRHWTRSGWQRTEGAFLALWRPTHVATALDVGDLPAWVLEPRG